MNSNAQPFDSNQLDAARDLLLDFDLRAAGGASTDFDEFCRSRPDLAAALRFLRDEAERPHFPDRSEELSLAARLQRHLGHEYSPRAALYSDTAPRAEGEGKNRYTVLEEIGRGGMGVVFKVWDADLRRFLAVKVSRARTFNSQRLTTHEKQRLARFLDEAQITGQLEHPGVVPVHDVGIDEEGRVYFTMRLVRGKNLTQVFERAWSDDPETPQARVIEALIDLCDTLDYAHDKGVVHRDLKPSNVMVGRFGAVYVMDWGVARVVGKEKRPSPSARRDSAVTEVLTTRRDDPSSSSDSSLQTMEGDIVGTPAYMAPEQAAGRLEEISTRADIYSIGAMLYHFLARHRPYVGSEGHVDARLMQMRILEGPPRPLFDIDAKLSPELVAICERAMARDPRQRYSSARELGSDLRAYLSGNVVNAFEQGAWAELRKWVRRNRAFSATAAALLVLLAFLPIFWTSRELRAANAERDFEQAKFSMSALLQIPSRRDESGAVPPVISQALEDALDGLRFVARNDLVLAYGLVKTTLESCERVGLYDEAEALAREFVGLASTTWGDEDARIRSLRSRLCAYANSDGRFEDAARVARELIAASERAGDAELAQRARVHLFAALAGMKNTQDEAFDEVRRNPQLIREAIDSPDAPPALIQTFAAYLSQISACDEIERIIELLRASKGLRSTFEVRTFLVSCVAREDLERAIDIQASLVEDQERTLAPIDPLVPRAHKSLASLFEKVKDLDAAREHWNRTFELGVALPADYDVDAGDCCGRAIGFAVNNELWSEAVTWADQLAGRKCSDPDVALQRLNLAAEVAARARAAQSTR